MKLFFQVYQKFLVKYTKHLLYLINTIPKPEFEIISL